MERRALSLALEILNPGDSPDEFEIRDKLDTTVEIIRYRPGEAIRWLATGAENLRRGAQTRGWAAINVQNAEASTVKESLKSAAGALMDLGKSAYTDLMHSQAEASEYVLQADHFDVVRNGTIRSIPYSAIKDINFRSEKAHLKLDNKSELIIKPIAHLLVGHAKVPIGWSRNDIEVPFELLIEEIAARAKVEIE